MHPGEFLADDLNEIEVSPAECYVILAVSPGTVAAIIEGRRDMDAEFALRLSHYCGTTARSWTDLQTLHDLKVAEKKAGPKILILKEVRPAPKHLLKKP